MPCGTIARDQMPQGEDPSRRPPDASVRIPWAAPAFGDAEQHEVLEVLRSTRITMGPKVRAFEAGMERLLGVGHAVALTTGTAALDTVLKALGVGPGDEVIVPAFTYVATVNAVVYQGATPVMVDVEPATLNLDPAAVRAAMSSRTRAVIPIDYGGCAADYDALEPLAREHGAVLLQDAAHSLGGAHRGRQPGAFGVGATLSFHIAKLITTGEGGMVVTNDRDLAEQVRAIRNQGEPAEAKYTFTRIGQNYRMTDLHAALGLAQLARLPELLARRQAVARWYHEDLDGMEGLVLPRPPATVVHPWFLFSVLCRDTASRDRAAATLAAAGVETRVCWPRPVYRQPAYARREIPRHPCPVAESAAARVLSLPVHPQLTRDDVALISRTLIGAAR
jgi:perosamine synthetase